MKPRVLAMLLLLGCTKLHAQSEAASVVSELSVAPAAAVASAVIASVPAGARWTIRGVEAGAHAGTVLLQASGSGVVASVEVSVEVAGRLLAATGSAVEVSAHAGGLLLCVAGEAIAILPNEASRALIHQRRLSR